MEIAGTGMSVGKSNVSHKYDSFESWKYPHSVGADTGVDDVNFNSHKTSEYAIERMSNIDGQTIEPFILFEFMKINEDMATKKMNEGSTALKNVFSRGGGAEDTAVVDGILGLKDVITEWWKNIWDTAWRDYTGSIALYMPKDIQINDAMVYNEDTRQIGALAESLFTKGDAHWTDIVNPTVLFSPTVLTALGGGLGKVFTKGNTSAAIAAFAGYGIGDIISTEIQRTSGKIGNPNELLRYASTSLRTFTFNWIFLPDSEDESKQITGLIKFFRKSAHAKKSSDVMLTVPDHCVVSFHGAKDMIQLPACFIETVNVTYNPNNTSFFKRNNAPVEIGLSVGLKEIVPIYADDVERGY
jgi:hypothetical protein